ncbi:MAG: hypothetical protein R3C55_08505 [Parvularculaceae bacterium]
MKSKAILIASVAALALVSCSKKETGPETKSSAAAARAEAGSPLDAPFRLKDSEPVDVDALFSLLPDEARPSYASAKFDEKIGATVVTDLRIEDRDPTDEVVFDGLAIDRAELYGVDMAAIDRVKAVQGMKADAPFEKIFDKVRLFGVKPIDPKEDGGASIGAVELDQFRVRQGGFKDDEEAHKSAAWFFNAFDLAGLYFKDFEAGGAAEDNSLKFKAPDLRLVGLGGGKLGAIIAKDFDYEVAQSPEARAALAQQMGGPAGAILSGPLRGFIAPDHQRVTVNAFEWRDIDFSGILGYGLKGEKPPLTATNLISFGAMKASDMDTYIGGKHAAKVAEASMEPVKFTWLIPSSLRSVSKGGVYDFTAYLADEEEEGIAILKKHGLDSVKGDGDFSWKWDAAKGGANLVSTFKTSNLADFSMDLGLAGLEIEKINQLIEAGDTNAVFTAGSFKGFGLTLTDKKLLDAVFDVAALQMGGTGEDLRQSTPAMLRLSGVQAANLNPRIPSYIDAIATFLSDGGTLEIAARPKEPVPLSALMSVGPETAATVPDLIDLTITQTDTAKK